MIHSDWHIHSEYSHDSSTSLDTIAQAVQQQGLRRAGITDHCNLNDQKFIGDLNRSAAGVLRAQKKYPFLVLGVELTPITKHQFDYIAKRDTTDGYVVTTQSLPYEIALQADKEYLKSLGVRYAVGASHFHLNGTDKPSLDECTKEWFHQQMWLACADQVTVLGHPWWNMYNYWYDDFSVIPRGMNIDLGAALKANGKYVECNSFFFMNNRTDKFRRQYAEFLREMFEMGVPVTYGSDSHVGYPDIRGEAEKYLSLAGFVDGDISEIAENDLW